MQSSLPTIPGLHVACIMDGNGRWAERRRRPRALGHVAGVESVRRVVEAAPTLGVGTLTLYAFSADNWARPETEVSALMGLFGTALRAEVPRLRDAGVRLSVIGRRDRLPGALTAAVARAEWETRRGTRLHLRLAVDYSAREAIRRAAHAYAADAQAALSGLNGGTDAGTGAPSFDDYLARATGGAEAPPVDLLLRTAGEQRLSDFLLWECAYAEFLFLDTLWPDVTADTLATAVATFGRRERRFGALPARAA